MLGRLTTKLSPPVQRRLRRLRHPVWFGSLRGVAPISSCWGQDRGTPVDRYYIEQFLAEHRSDIRGRVVEVLNSDYTERFGTDVQRADVLDIDRANPKATIVADLTAADHVPDGQFDCFILTQTLQFIYDTHAAVRHAHRLLRPGGVLLATVPVVSRVESRYGREADKWRFTAGSCHRLFGDVFGEDATDVRTYGNVFAAIAFLTGAATEELPRRKLDVRDESFPILVSIRAVRA